MKGRAGNSPREPDSGPPRLEFDFEKYAHHLDDVDASEDEKRAYLETLWSILFQFVDMGFCVHIDGVCGDVENNLAELAPTAAHGVILEGKKNDIDEEDAPPGRKRSTARKTP